MTVENEFNVLIDRLQELKFAAAESSLASNEKIQKLKNQLEIEKQKLFQLETEQKEKDFKESMEMTILYDQQVDALIHSEIEIPETQLKLFWDQLKLRVDPAPFGGIRVTLGFHHSMKLPELRFTLKFNDQIFSISDCDPLVIGLSDLVDQLNADNRSGALARFICRIRARYTAQYSSY